MFNLAGTTSPSRPSSQQWTAIVIMSDRKKGGQSIKLASSAQTLHLCGICFEVDPAVVEMSSMYELRLVVKHSTPQRSLSFAQAMTINSTDLDCYQEDGCIPTEKRRWFTHHISLSKESKSCNSCATMSFFLLPQCHRCHHY